MKDLETKYKCAGVCYKPLFYLTKPLTEGAPEAECVETFIKEYAGATGVGIVAIVTGLTLLFASFGSIPLCSDFASGTGM